ncbi:hypothetical protein ACMA1D_10610 [Streptomyces sp. 796.1]|uniref:hypothetical protein n=1 Tax=Streptomyces sp. 796.1 TaxID=3163029 RepID=UPI0039C9571B
MAEDPRPYSDDMTQGDQAAQLRRTRPGPERPDEAELLAAMFGPPDGNGIYGALPAGGGA